MYSKTFHAFNFQTRRNRLLEAANDSDYQQSNPPTESSNFNEVQLLFSRWYYHYILLMLFFHFGATVYAMTMIFSTMVVGITIFVHTYMYR